jgi:hypothetical protein
MSRITSSDKAMQTERKPTAKRRRKEKVEAKDQGSKQPLTNYEYSLLVSCFHLLFLKYNCSFWRLCIRLWIPSWRNTMTRNIRYSGACMSNSSPIAQSWRGHCTSDLWHDNMTCITRGCCILVLRRICCHVFLHYLHFFVEVWVIYIFTCSQFCFHGGRGCTMSPNLIVGQDDPLWSKYVVRL